MTQPTQTQPTHDDTDRRFAFGANWQSFLASLDDQRIDQARRSLLQLLDVDEAFLNGKRFLDIGSGSGLFSLVARRMGASVTSIDYDEQSVACGRELRRRESTPGRSVACEQDGDSDWRVLRGSVLDRAWLAGLGTFDVVYAWGVLHHTGQMDRAIANAARSVAQGGLLAIAIYNDQGTASRRWAWIKRAYHRLPAPLRGGWVVAVAGLYETKFAVARAMRGRNPLPFADWRAKKRDRGMSAWHDWVDWVGGWPFEVAKPEAVITPLRQSGFVLERLSTVGNGWGCNQYVFRRVAPSDVVD